MREIYRAPTPVQAHFICQVLLRHGIRAVVENETLFGVRGGVPCDSSTLPVVAIPEGADAEMAGALVEAVVKGRANGSADDPPWLCSTCQKPVEGLFDACWRCGAEAPGDQTEG